MKYEENQHQVIKPTTYKYTEAQEEEMRVLYQAEETQEGRDTVVLDFSERWDRPKKSIIAKI